MDEHGGAVDGRVHVVAGCEAAPLLGVAEPALDDVPVLVVVGVERDRPTAAGTATFAMPLLIFGLGNDGLDAPLAQVLPDRAGRVRLGPADHVRTGAWPPNFPADP